MGFAVRCPTVKQNTRLRKEAGIFVLDISPIMYYIYMVLIRTNFQRRFYDATTSHL